jgi:hypothetical protein
VLTRNYASTRRPRPIGYCDRCNRRDYLDELRWQWDWRGSSLQNLRILVCKPCEDIPQEQLRIVVIGADPYPLKDPRPGYLASESAQGPQWERTSGGEIITGEDGIPIIVNP